MSKRLIKGGVATATFAVAAALVVAGPAMARPLSPQDTQQGDAASPAATLNVSNSGCTTVGPDGKTPSADRTVWFQADNTSSDTVTAYQLNISTTANGKTTLTPVGLPILVLPGEKASSINEGIIAAVAPGTSTTYEVDATYPTPGATSEDDTTTTAVATRTATACPAGAATVEYPLFRTAYDGAIYELVEGKYPVHLDSATYAALPVKSYSPAPVNYVKYPWDSNISAVTFWNASAQSDTDYWQWLPLTANEWKAAGRPSPRTAGFIYGSAIYRLATGDDLFIEGPSATVEGIAPIHKLTYAQYVATGRHHFVTSTAGVEKVSWAPEIAYFQDAEAATGSQPLSYSEWQLLAFPTPSIVSSFAGEQFYKKGGCSTSTIYYAGPQMNRAITFQEWVNAGSPVPQDGPDTSTKCGTAPAQG